MAILSHSHFSFRIQYVRDSKPEHFKPVSFGFDFFIQPSPKTKGFMLAGQENEPPRDGTQGLDCVRMGRDHAAVREALETH